MGQKPEIIIRRGRPRIENIGKTLKATEPWKDLGMSRRTWENRRKEERGDAEKLDAKERLPVDSGRDER